MKVKSPRAIWYVAGDPEFNRVFVALGYPEASLMCISREGEILWETPTKNQVNLIAPSPANRKIFIYKMGRRGPNSLSCVDYDGREMWSKTLDSKISSMCVSDQKGICVLGTMDSQLLFYSDSGECISVQKLAAWSNPIYSFIIKHTVIAFSERGIMYIFDIGGRMIKAVRKADLCSKLYRVSVTRDFSGLVDFCSSRKNILHLFDHDDDSFLDVAFEGRIKEFQLLENGMAGVMDNTKLFMMDEDHSFEWAVDIKEKIITIACDRWGGNLLAGTDRFNLYMFDRNGKIQWVKNTGCKDIDRSEAERGFSSLPEGDVLGTELDVECKSRDIFIENIEKYLLPSLVTTVEPKEKESDEWLDEILPPKRNSIISDFRPFAVEKKMVVKSNLISQKGLPIIIIQVENTTDHTISDIRIFTEIDDDIFYVKKSPIEYPLLRPNTAKKFAVRFIPTSNEGRVKGECRMTYISDGQETEIFIKNFTLNNVWPNMTPLDIGKRKWGDYVREKAKLSAERFTSLQPKNLIPLVDNLSGKKGFHNHERAESKKESRVCYSSHTSFYQYGLEVDITPSKTERGVFIFVVNFYSDNTVNLSLLEYMFMDELDRLVKEEEEKWPVIPKEEPLTRDGRYRSAQPTSILRIPAPKWSEKKWVDIPVWNPEDRESPEYHPAGLPTDFSLYDKYSDYFSDFFTPYPEKKMKKKKVAERIEVIEEKKPLVEPGKGLVYLFEEASPVRAFTVFKELLNLDIQGLYITREYPKKVVSKYGLENVPYLWLTNVPEKNALRPTDTEKLRFAFKRHLKSQPDEDASKKVILLDGVEYLVTHNTFSSILKLLQAIGDMISMSKGTLIIPISPATFHEHERKLLERESDEIIY